jgi:RHS repeat-associated protein
MSLLRWFPGLRRKSPVLRRRVLELERLEDRTLLSTITWGLTGDGNWDVGANWQGGQVPGNGDTAVINTVAAATITIQASDAIQVQALTTGSNDTLSFTGGSLTVTAGTSSLDGPLSMTAGSLTATGAGTNCTANGTTSVSSASLYAKNGATLSLPGMTSYTNTNTTSNTTNVTFQADGSGSMLDVSALSSLTEVGQYAVENLDATNGGTLKLTSFTSLAGHEYYGGQSINISDTGGSSVLDSNLTTLDQVGVSLDGTDASVASSWTQFTNGGLKVTGGSYNLTGLTNIDGSSLDAEGNGTTLAVTSVTSYTQTNSSAYFRTLGIGATLDVSGITGLGTFSGGWYVFASANNSTIKLSKLASINQPNYPVDLAAMASGAQLDVSALTSFIAGPGQLEDANGGVIVAPVLASLDRVTMIVDGNEAAYASAWTSVTHGSLQISGGSYPLNLTDFDYSSVGVSGGATVSMAKLTNYSGVNAQFAASGASTLDMSALTTLGTLSAGWLLYVTGGSILNLSGLTTVNQPNVGVSLQVGGIGSQINLSGLTSLAVAISSNAAVNTGGELLWSQLTSLNDVSVYSDGTDADLASAWTSFTHGGLTLTGHTYNLPALTDIDNSSLYVQYGASLALPNLVSYSETNYTTFEATGASSILNLSALTTLGTVSNNWIVEALAGGTVDLSGLPAIDEPNANLVFSADGTNSVLKLPNVATFSGSPGTSMTVGNNADINTVAGTLTIPQTASGVTLTVPALPWTVSFVTNGTLSGGPIFNISAGHAINLGGGTFTGGTVFNVGAGATVNLTSSTFTGGVTLNVGAGASVDLTSYGVVTYSGLLAGSGAGAVHFSGGTINVGLGGLTLSFPGGMFQWTGGYLSTQLGNVTNLGTMNLSGTSGKIITNDGTLDNFGTITQSGANLSLHSDNVVGPTTLLIEPGAAYLLQSDTGIDNQAGGFTAIINRGLIRKTAGTGTSQVLINTNPINNTGTIEVDCGTLYLNATGISQVSGTTLAGGTWKALNGATLQLPTGTSITDSQGTIALDGSGASVTGIAGLASNEGSFTLTNGASFTTTGSFSNGGTVTVAPGSTLTVNGSYTQTSTANLDDQIGSSSSFGKVNASGAANLAGAFNLALVNGFGPTEGQAFQVMNFASAGQNFGSFNGLAPLFTEALNPSNLTLTASTSGIDLQPTSVGVPTAVTSGQSITVTWQVSNNSATTVAGSWKDAVYLSPTPTISNSSVLLGQWQQNGVAANGTYTGTVNAAVPPLLPGYYYAVVQVDSLNQVPDPNRTNNTLAMAVTPGTPTPITVTVPALTASGPNTYSISDTFTSADQDRYYQVTVPAGGALRIALASSASSGATAIYASQGTLPTSYNSEFVADVANEASQTLTVPQVAGGTYYILVHSIAGPSTTAGYALTVTQTTTLAVAAISSYAAGNAGNATIEIDGDNFTPQTTANLILETATIAASTIEFVNAGQLFATFELAHATIGDYTVAVQQGTDMATAPTSFSVVAANTAPLAISLSAPQYVRSGRTASLVLSYTNESNNDVAAPLLGLDSTNSNILFSTPDDPNNFVAQAEVLAIAPNGPAGILRPGQTGQLMLTLLSNDTINNDQIPVSVRRLQAGQPNGLASQASAFQPPAIPTAPWNVLFSNFLTIVGSTTDSYNAALAQAATYLGSLGEATSEISNVGRLWSFLLAQADAAFPTPTLSPTVDAAQATPGKLSLAIGRTFQSSIVGRDTPSTFGLGWASTWQSSLNVDGGGNVTLNNGGAIAYFAATANGTYHDTAGEYGTLARASSNFVYTAADGTQYVFQASGLSTYLLSYIQDTNGNRITVGYDANALPATLTYANPGVPSQPAEQLRLTYNNQNLVSQVADGTGNLWIYSYDAAGHLVSVTAPGNLTTSYAYDTGTNPETTNTLLSVTYADGSQDNFAYDPATGRLTGTSKSAASQPGVLFNTITYAYAGQGEVTSTDANDNIIAVWFNDVGSAGRIEDPRGAVSSYQFDVNGNPTSFIDAAGNTYQYSYDHNGNLTKTVNPLGQTVQMTFGALGKLTSITDAAGNATKYTSDGAGNLRNISYPDGTQQSFTHDQLGNLTETFLQNGDGISYQTNAQGLVTQRTFADGTAQSFAYDPHGNLLTAQTYDAQGNLTGTTTMSYNAGNQLLSVAHPGGRFLHFTYNAAGQRIQSVDQSGFTVSYMYDSLGRLSELTDGSGNLIAQYTYTNLGQLAHKQYGNGTSATYAYDAAGNLISIANYAPDGITVNSSFAYTYDLLGQVSSVTDSAGNVTTYGYDATGQLIQVNLPGAQSIGYVYNSAGDRTEVINNGTPTSYASNALNEITRVGSTLYSYDPTGNVHTVTDSTGTTNYNYNDLNQLVSISAPDGTVTNFQYSPLGFLVGTTRISGGTRTQTNYLVDPTGLGNVVASYNGSGALLAHFVFGIGLASQTAPSGTGYYDFDASGNTIGITGPTGAYANQYRYLPFGETTVTSQTVATPFTYGGQGGVMQIESNVYYMRARAYAPTTGQFMSNDSIGLRSGDANVRRYADNEPISRLDPSGYAYFTYQEFLKSIDVAKVVEGAKEFYKFHYIEVTADEYASGVLQDTYALRQIAKSGFSPAGRALTGALAERAAAQGAATVGSAIIGGLESANHVALAFGGGYLVGSLINSGLPQSARDAIGDLLYGVFGPGVENIQRLFQDNTRHDPQDPIADLVGKESVDPNALIGPVGAGTQNDVADGGTFPYTIEFENDGTAAAQEVVVAEQLDANLDWSTFQLGSFGFGPITVTGPAGLTQDQTTVAYHNTDGSVLNVAVVVDFNVQTGLLTVTFTSLDPLTGQAPAGVFDGFLPPDDSSHVGEGFVQYTIHPKANLATGTTIIQQASIVFDINAALATNTAVNTIDATPPSSTVNALPADSPPSFLVSWTGLDDAGGSGLASYDVYYAANGGPWQQWQNQTAQTSAVYNGQLGNTYSFYAIAHDNVGNIEAKPAVAEAQTKTALYQTTLTEPAGTTRPTAEKISTLLGSHYSDPDGSTHTRPGIAVIGTTGSGTWQYSTNGKTWTNIASVAPTNALLLPQADQVRFLPAGLAAGSAELLYIAWDGSLGSAGHYANASIAGDGTPFSTGAGLLTVSLSVVLQAPLWLATTTTLAPVLPGSSSPAGQTIADAFGAVFSGDNGQSAGVAISGKSAAKSGTWQYRVYNSLTQSYGPWTPLPAVVSVSKALLLGALDMIAFVPSAGFAGVVSLQVHAWDGSGTGTAGQVVNLGKTGGASPYSSSTLTTMLRVNTAPTQNSADITLTPALPENKTSAAISVKSLLTSAHAADADKGASLGLALTGVSGPGTWQYKLASTWLAAPANLSDTQALLLLPSAQLRFVPTPNAVGTASVGWLAWDQTQGSAGLLVDTTASGGASGFGTATAAATLAMIAGSPRAAWSAGTPLFTPVAPNNNNPPGDQVQQVFGPFFQEPGTPVGIAISAVSGSANGTWQYSNDGVNWLPVLPVSVRTPLKLAASDYVRFVPKPGFLASVTLTAYAWDGTTLSATPLIATCLVNTSPSLTA